MFEKLLRYDIGKIYCFIDYETQNLCLHECWNLPWQVAIINFKSNFVVDEYESLIKWEPLLEIKEKIAKMTHYDYQKMILEGKNPKTIADEVEEKLAKSDFIVGHNLIRFDQYINNSFFRKVNKKIYNFTPKLLDTNCLLKGIELNDLYNKEKETLAEYQYRIDSIVKKGVKSNMGYACRKYSIPFIDEERHNALVDLRLNIEVFKKIIWQQEI